MGLYTSLIRPLMFSLSPERAQKLAEASLKIRFAWRLLRPFFDLVDPRLETDMAGIHLTSPVGLAAGYDKDCRLIHSLSNLGLGYMVGGTILTEPREGNPRPRLARNPMEGSLVNSLGFPSHGLGTITHTLGRQNPDAKPLVLSISGLSTEEFMRCYQVLQPLSTGIELNISSPNTQGIRVFQESSTLQELLRTLAPLKEKPLFLKLPPYFDEDQRTNVLKLVDFCLQYSVDGITVSNTWPVDDRRMAVGRGGLSGKPLFHHMLHMVREVRNYAGPDLVINACGGVSSGQDALQALRAGANTVQIFTGFIYQGPGLFKKINRYILHFMDREGIASVADIRRETTEN